LMMSLASTARLRFPALICVGPSADTSRPMASLTRMDLGSSGPRSVENDHE